MRAPVRNADVMSCRSDRRSGHIAKRRQADAACALRSASPKQVREKRIRALRRPSSPKTYLVGAETSSESRAKPPLLTDSAPDSALRRAIPRASLKCPRWGRRDNPGQQQIVADPERGAVRKPVPELSLLAALGERRPPSLGDDHGKKLDEHGLGFMRQPLLKRPKKGRNGGI